MAVYLVTWNINKAGASYQDARTRFLGHLDRYENVKDSGLETVRWISTSSTADQLSADLRTKLDDNDRIFVTKLINGGHQGWLDKSVWDWINARI